MCWDYCRHVKTWADAKRTLFRHAWEEISLALMMNVWGILRKTRSTDVIKPYTAWSADKDLTTHVMKAGWGRGWGWGGGGVVTAGGPRVT